MPPKRTRTSAAGTGQNKRSRGGAASKDKTSETTTAPRGRAQSDGEILDAFALFAVPRESLNEEELEGVDDEDEEGEGVIKVLDVRRCLNALQLPRPPPDFFDDGQTHLTRSQFLELAQKLRSMAPSPSRSPTPAASPAKARRKGKQKQDPEQADVDHAFALFTTPIPSIASGKRVEVNTDRSRRIMLSDLKRVARELKEDVDDKVLRMMIEEANGASGPDVVQQGVGREEFETIMRRAGVFG